MSEARHIDAPTAAEARGRPSFSLERDRLDAVIMDLDGAVVRTKPLHLRAWRRALGAFLDRRAVTHTGHRAPFHLATDFDGLADGRTLYDGVSAFLASRGIELPWGTPGDTPGRATVCGLGNEQHRLFLELLQDEGVEACPHALDLVRELRAAGFRLAVVSASRSSATVLLAVGASELFDVKVDGEDTLRRGLAGPPEPDMLLAAANDLSVPARRAAAIEASVAGIDAARAASCGRVLAVDRGDQRDVLDLHGADAVVRDLSRIRVVPGRRGRTTWPLPPPDMESLLRRLRHHHLVLFLDYDGTLTPLVDRPDEATLSATMRSTLERAARHFRVAVVSGRDVDDLRERVGLDALIYAGSHGFDLLLPEGRREHPPAAEAALPELADAAARLERRLADIDGARVERKRYAVAVHHHDVPEARASEVEAVFGTALADHPGLRRRDGRGTFELVPDVDWDKGVAVRWLLAALGLERADVLPLYIGDALADEDAFAVLEEDGIGIAVTDDGATTSADYLVDGPVGVQTLIEQLCEADAAAP